MAGCGEGAAGGAPGTGRQRFGEELEEEDKGTLVFALLANERNGEESLRSKKFTSHYWLMREMEKSPFDRRNSRPHYQILKAMRIWCQTV
jgi:hypothetical protein